MSKSDRDIEKEYSTSEIVSKLRRLADDLEAGENLKFKSLVNVFMYLTAQHFQLSMNVKMVWKS